MDTMNPQVDRRRHSPTSETSTAWTNSTLTAWERVVARFLPSIGDAIFVCVLLGALLGLQGKALGPDGDIGWGLRIGETVLRHGVPRSEFMLSATYGRPVVYWEWLSQACYALVNQMWGLNGVVALAALLVAGASLVLYVALRRRGVALVLALPLTVLGIGLTSITWTARAQLFSLLLTLLWSELIWRYWRGGDTRILWALPPVMALWANLHGGFLAGLILLATAVAVAWLFPAGRACADPRRLSLALLASVLSTLLNPWGLGLWGHILAYAANPLIPRYTQEYQSPDFHSTAGLLFLALVFVVGGVWLWLALLKARAVTGAALPPDATALPGGSRAPSSSIEPLAVAHVALWTALAFTSVRFVPLWSLIALPILGEALSECAHLSRGVPAPLRSLSHRVGRLDMIDAQVGRGVWSSLAVVFVIVTLIGGGVVSGTSAHVLDVHFDPRVFPVPAVARLRAIGAPPGQGFTTFAWGGYLDEALPEYHVFIDSRSDDYDQRLLADYADIVGLAPDWRTLLARYHVRWALLPSGDALTQALQLAPDWRCNQADAGNVATLCLLVTSP